MFSDIKRDDKYLNCLCDFVSREYNIDATSIVPAKRGFYGETWRLNAANARYFLKIVYAATNKDIYERSFHIIQHLCDHGIDFISQIVKTKDGGLSTRFDGSTLGVFNWIDGENVQNEFTKIEEYKMLAKIMQFRLAGLLLLAKILQPKMPTSFSSVGVNWTMKKFSLCLKKIVQKLSIQPRD